MKRYVLSFVGVLSLFTIAEAQDFNTRILIHGQQTIGDSKFGVAGWLVAPNITSASNKWLTIAGPRYSAETWHIEVMGGAVVQEGESTPLIDIRVGFGPELFGNIGIAMWHNSEWIDPLGGDEKFYLYHQIVYPLLNGVVVSFIETENLFDLKNNPDFSNDWSIGAGTAINLSEQMTLIGVYQHHFDQSNQVWLRTVINLK